MEWSSVQAGSVLAWRGVGRKHSRRMLVESVEEAFRPESRSRMVWGVEVTQSYRPRSRRGVRGWYKTKPFLVWEWEVETIVPPDSSDRVQALIEYVREFRAKWGRQS
jgi:hypothetical protein